MQMETHSNNAKKTVVTTKRVSVIIPSYNSLEDLKECVESLLDLNAQKWLEIIVIDNDSDQQVVKYLSDLKRENKIKLMLNKVNYGFSYAINQGISLADSENDILLLNNDAIVTPGAIENMQKYSQKIPQCGIIIPQQILPPKTKTINTHVPYANPHHECDVSLSTHHRNIINTPIFIMEKL